MKKGKDTRVKLSPEELEAIAKKEAEKQAEEERLHNEKISAMKIKYARPGSEGRKVPLTDIFTLTVGDKTCYLRKPDRKVLSMARAAGDGDYIDTNEAILDALWLEGDEEIRVDDDYFLQAIPFLNQLVEAKEVSLKKN